MKKTLLFISILSITLSGFAQISRNEYNTIIHYRNILMNVEITSINTSIEEYLLFGEKYLLIYGERGMVEDSRPLLVRILPNGFKEIQNLYPIIGNPDPSYRRELIKRNMIVITQGCIGYQINFFEKAQFLGYLWKKYPKNEYWRRVY